MCGLSYYLISFKYEGFTYFWTDEYECYFNFTTQKEFKKPPVGATWDDSCWISKWRMDDDD